MDEPILVPEETPVFAPEAKVHINFSGPITTWDLLRVLLKLAKDNNWHEAGCEESICTCIMKDVHVAV